VYRPPISQPRVLLVVAHPGVGEGLATLLRLERRFAVRRAAKLGEAVQLARDWPADAVLVDAGILPREGKVPLGAPALVLAGSEAESAAAASALDDPRGWVAKDSAAADLVAAVERLLTRHADEPAGSLAVALVGLLALALLALLLYLLWIAIT
jgi:DNA-binding NarL/FixJ family response regulator